MGNGELVIKYEYKNEVGCVLGYIERYHTKVGEKIEKTFKAMFYHDGQLVPRGPDKPTPLFGGELVPTLKGQAIVCEGEKCAYALQCLGFPAFCSLFGGGSAKYADWSKLASSNLVYLFPDNDEKGEKYINTVGLELRKLNPDIQLCRVDISPTKPGEDIADWLMSRCPEWDGLSPIPLNARQELYAGVRELLKKRFTFNPVAPVVEVKKVINFDGHNDTFLSDLQSALSFESIFRYFGHDPGIQNSHGGGNVLCLSPLCADTNPSFDYNEERGLWNCFATDIGGNKLQLLQKLGHCEFKDAIDIACKITGLSRPARKKPKLPAPVTEVDFEDYRDIKTNLLKALDSIPEDLPRPETYERLENLYFIIATMDDVHDAPMAERIRAKFKYISKTHSLNRIAAQRKEQKRAEDPEGGDDQISHMDAANATLAKIGSENLLYQQGSFWLWNKQGGVWQRIEDRWLKAQITKILKGRTSKSLVDSVFDILKSLQLSNVQFDAPSDSIYCKNGELVLVDGRYELTPHVRERYRTTQIPVAYDSNATCPRFLQFLDEIFQNDEDKEDKKLILLQMLGYSLLSDTSLEKFMILTGNGANGKSVFLSVLVALLGKVNCSAVKPAHMDSPFQIAHLQNKLANIVTELREGEQLPDAIIKALISGEIQTAEHKYGKPFDFRPFCTLWFAVNHIPSTRDFSEGLLRRAIILSFNEQFMEGGHSPDFKLTEKLLDELPGILTLVLDILADLKTSGKGISSCQSCVELKKEWRINNDQVRQFVEEMCVIDKTMDLRTPSKDIYVAYRQWASENGVGFLSHVSLSSRLQGLGVKLRKGTHGIRLFIGISLSEPWQRDSLFEDD